MWSVIEAYLFNVVVGEIPVLVPSVWLFDNWEPMQFDDNVYMEHD